MIPVMTSTKTDKSAIALAGVEAGAKIFVPCGDESFGSLAHTPIADQNSRTIVCARNRNVEDFIFNIDISLLPFSSLRCAPPSAGFALSSNSYRNARHDPCHPEFH
jgi:hypothetical protein